MLAIPTKVACYIIKCTDHQTFVAEITVQRHWSFFFAGGGYKIGETLRISIYCR